MRRAADGMLAFGLENDFSDTPSIEIYWQETSSRWLPVVGDINKTSFRIIIFYGNDIHLKGG